MNEESIVTRAKEIIKDAVNGVLLTVDENGFPHPRTMWTADVDDNFNIYFLTGRSLLKCKQIRQNPKVSVFWTRVKANVIGWDYAFIKGEAEVTDDQSLRDKYWDDELKAYFPKGKEDPEYVILIIKPKELMVMDSHKYPLDRMEF